VCALTRICCHSDALSPNAAAEAFFSSLEWEVLSRHTFADTRQAQAVLLDWCYGFYNQSAGLRERRARTSGYSPAGVPLAPDRFLLRNGPAGDAQVFRLLGQITEDQALIGRPGTRAAEHGGARETELEGATVNLRSLITRLSVCLVADHAWVKVSYPEGDGRRFLRCLRCGKESHGDGSHLVPFI
jgi:hypothetical protein